MPGAHISVNHSALPRVRELIANADALRVIVSQDEAGVTIVDAGIACPGSFAAGVLIARICMADLGRVSLSAQSTFVDWPWQVQVSTSQPLLACLCSQYAGWHLHHDKTPKFNALGSGPGRALAGKEALLKELRYVDHAEHSCLVLETSNTPPPVLTRAIAEACGVSPGALTLVLTPTGSLAGVTQIAARVVEVAMHKAHELKFPLAAVLEGVGNTPLPPPSNDDMLAMGRTNDTILFGGDVHLWVDTEDAAAQALAEELPSSSSRDYGKPFATVFKHYDYDFFKIDPLLFSPARVAVTSVRSGRTFRAGRVDEALLKHSFGL